jgi:Holliday junction resolvase
MSSKSKGTRYERELFHLINKSGWQPIRIAGSGSTTITSTDLVVGNKKKKRHLAIECKSIKGKNKHLPSYEIKQLLDFSNKFGAEPWLAIRFNQLGWYFLNPKRLKKSKKGNFNISVELAKSKGIKLKELLK